MKFLAFILIVIAGWLGWYVVSTARSTSELTFAQKLAACGGLPNGSEQRLRDTSRAFINLPRDTFPDKDHALSFVTASGTTKALWISNAGPYGEALAATADCWSYYYEFDGPGEMVLTASGTQPYTVRFVVAPI